MVVIIAAGPFTLRSGRSDSRSIRTPSTPDAHHGHDERRQHDADQRQPGQHDRLAVHAHQPAASTCR